jgi:hypothetical protein
MAQNNSEEKVHASDSFIYNKCYTIDVSEDLNLSGDGVCIHMFTLCFFS